MPDEIPQSASEELKSELKRLSEHTERLRIEAKKNAEEAAQIIDKMATIQRRMIEEEASRRGVGGKDRERPSPSKT